MGGLIYGRVKLAEGKSGRFAVEPAALEDTLQRLMQGGDWSSDGERRWVRVVEIEIGEPVDPKLREEMHLRLDDFRDAISELQGRVAGLHPDSR